MKINNILAEGESFMYTSLPSTSSHHSPLPASTQGEIQAQPKRAWCTGTAWFFLLVTKHATSPATAGQSWTTLSTHEGCCQSVLGQLLTTHPVNGHSHPVVVSDDSGCSHTVGCPKQQFWQNCYLLFWFYTLVIVTQILPKQGPHACLSLPLLTKASGWLKCATSSFISLPSPGNVLP